MIKLFSLKQQAKAGSNPQSTKKTSAAYLRVQKGNDQSIFLCSLMNQEAADSSD